MVVPAGSHHSARVDDEELTYREAVKTLRETEGTVVDERLKSLDALHRALNAAIIMRLDAMDKAVEVMAENVNRVPTLLDREVARVVEMFRRSEELVTERFSGVTRQLIDRDVRGEQDKRTSEKAVESAFQAQKEALTKSDALTTKLLDGQQSILAASSKTIDDKIAVINGRLDRGEGGTKGARDERVETHMNIGTILGIIGGIIGALGLVAALASAIIGHNGPSPVPTVGADTKRVDDLISRLDALSARMNSLQSPKPSSP